MCTMERRNLMTKVVVLGHGGYGSAMRRNIEMLAGVQEDYYYVDFNEEDDQETLKGRWERMMSFSAAIWLAVHPLMLPLQSVPRRATSAVLAA